MASRFQDLLDAVEAALGAHVNIDATDVDQGRTHPIKDSKHIGIWLGDDVPVGDFGPQNLNFIDWDVNVFVEIAIRYVTPSPDTELTDIRTDVHQALMTDHTQGGLTQMTIPAGAEQPDLTSEGETKAATYRLSWIFRIRTNITNLATV